MRRFAALRRFLSGFPEDSLESWIASEDPAKHVLADETLRQMGEEKTLAFLLATIELEEKRRCRRGWRNFVLILGGTVIAQYVLDTLSGSGRHFWLGGIAVTWGLMAVFVGTMPSKLHRQCIKRLANSDDQRTFPALVAALTCYYPIMADAVARRLIRMLPNVEAKDFAALPKDHQIRLYQFISPSDVHISNSISDRTVRQELARALLLACTRFGSGGAIYVTRRIANAKSKAGEDDTLQRTAQNCLPLLEKASAEQKVKVTEERKVVVRR